jgi:predicted PhzF superfamily epimerase YddE/YHI9
MVPGSLQHPVAFVDVFAEHPLAGNGLAVVGIRTPSTTR